MCVNFTILEWPSTVFCGIHVTTCSKQLAGSADDTEDPN
jgi:hypothetical protein